MNFEAILCIDLCMKDDTNAGEGNFSFLGAMLGFRVTIILFSLGMKVRPLAVWVPTNSLMEIAIQL